jgi:hypothetical protein
VRYLYGGGTRDQVVVAIFRGAAAASGQTLLPIDSVGLGLSCDVFVASSVFLFLFLPRTLWRRRRLLHSSLQRVIIESELNDTIGDNTATTTTLTWQFL